MGYKNCTSEVQFFSGYKMAEWGTIPQNGVHLAALVGTSNIRNNVYVYEQHLVCIFVVLTQYIYCCSFLLSLLFNKSLRFGIAQTF
jgi:hypothetical protein